MDSAVRLAVVLVLIAAMFALIATVGVPALPAEADQLIDSFCDILKSGRKVLNVLVNPIIINGCLACVLVVSNIDRILKLYGYIRKWFLG